MLNEVGLGNRKWLYKVCQLFFPFLGFFLIRSHHSNLVHGFTPSGYAVGASARIISGSFRLATHNSRPSPSRCAEDGELIDNSQFITCLWVVGRQYSIYPLHCPYPRSTVKLLSCTLCYYVRTWPHKNPVLDDAIVSFIIVSESQGERECGRVIESWMVGLCSSRWQGNNLMRRRDWIKKQDATYPQVHLLNKCIGGEEEEQNDNDTVTSKRGN